MRIKVRITPQTSHVKYTVDFPISSIIHHRHTAVGLNQGTDHKLVQPDAALLHAGNIIINRDVQLMGGLPLLGIHVDGVAQLGVGYALLESDVAPI